MEKLRYGTKEIIATVIAVVLVVVTEWAEISLSASGAVFSAIFEWAVLRIHVIAIAAAFFGPITGMIGGLGGDLITGMIFGQTPDYPEIIAMGLYGLFIGLYFGRMHFDIRSVDAATLFDFFVIQLMTGAFFTIFFIPMLRFLTHGDVLEQAVISGAKCSAGNGLIVAIRCPIVMLLASAIVNRRRYGTP